MFEYEGKSWTVRQCAKKWDEINPRLTPRGEPSTLSTPRPTTSPQNDLVFSRANCVTAIDSTLDDTFTPTTYSAAKIFDQQPASILAAASGSTSIDFYVEVPSQAPSPKRRRLRSDGHKGQDNLPCSSTAVSVTTSDNMPTPTTSDRQNVSCSAVNVDEEEEDVVMVPTPATLTYHATEKENKEILQLDHTGVSIEDIAKRMELLTDRPFKVGSLITRLYRIKLKTFVWTESSIEALKKAHGDWDQLKHVIRQRKFDFIRKRVSLVITIT